jgi:hypothetical protein
MATLKIDKATYLLIVTLVNASVSFIAYYISLLGILSPTEFTQIFSFITIVVNALLVWLAAETGNPPPNPAPTPTPSTPTATDNKGG